MKKIKDLLDKFDQVQTISKDDTKKLKGGGWGFLYRGSSGHCTFCDPDNDDG